MIINKQAEELNRLIQEKNPVIYNLLSKKGRAIFFPKKGILSQTAEAKGKKINATIGAAIEDDGSPMRLKSIAKNILLEPKDVFPYAPSYGKPELRKEWLKQMKSKNPSLKGITSLPVVTNALTHGLSTVAYMFVNPGDKIILTDKFWGNYRLIFENGYGAVLDTFNTFKDNGFDTAALRKKLGEGKGKKIVLLNFPNNPSGYTPTNKEAEKIIKIIKESAELGNDIIVICDDAYFGLIYENDVYCQSLFARLADIHENVLAIKVDGATKEDYVWGLRVGFLTYATKGIDKGVCQALEAKTAGAIRGNISNASHLSQSLVLNALHSKTYFAEKKEKYHLLKSRYEKVKSVLRDKKYKEFFAPLPFNSGYFMCVRLKNIDGEAVRKRLLEKYDVGVISIGNMIRIAFSAIRKELIGELFEKLCVASKECAQESK